MKSHRRHGARAGRSLIARVAGARGGRDRIRSSGPAASRSRSPSCRSKNLGGDADGALGAALRARALARPRSLRLLPARRPADLHRGSADVGHHRRRDRLRRLGGDRRAGAGEGQRSGRRATRSRIEVAPLRRARPAARSPQVGRRVLGRARPTCRAWRTRLADSILEFLTGERGPFDSQIALVSTRGGAPEGRLSLHLRHATTPARLTDERSIVVSPRWRPDARAILFTSYREHHAAALPGRRWRRGRSTPLVRRPGMILDGAWSPDGSRLARDARGGRQHRHLPPRSRAAQSSAGSPITGAIDVVAGLVARRPALRVLLGARGRAADLRDGRSTARGVARVSRTGNYNTSPAWSPKGDRLA